MDRFSIDHLIYNDLQIGKIPDDSILIIASDSPNERGRHPVFRQAYKSGDRRVLSVEEEDFTTVTLSANFFDIDKVVNLKNRKALVQSIPDQCPVWLDISGLTFGAWSSFFSALITSGRPLVAIYNEPQVYDEHSQPVTTTQFDLTSRLRRVSPPPGLANIRGPDDNSKTVFVPFLGFEGDRARHLFLQLDPSPAHIIPIIGVPGFRAEYPQFAVASNVDFFDQNNCYKNIRMTRANSPFESLQILKEIDTDFRDHYLYVAPLGTKPNTLGALMFLINNRPNVEIMYDNPLVKQGGREGIGKTHIYRIGDGR